MIALSTSQITVASDQARQHSIAGQRHRKTAAVPQGDDPMTVCQELHQLFRKLARHRFPFKEQEIPANGIYILFEKGERAHDGERIVRIGTHTGEGQLRSRLKQHFLMENKDRSIFRKNIGRAILNRRKDPFLARWELDHTPADMERLDAASLEKQQEIEKEVTAYIQQHFSFIVLPVPEKEQRLYLESRIISTVSRCTACGPGKDWLCLQSPKEKIRKSGLWLVNELDKEPLSEADMQEIRGALRPLSAST